jgi:small subunit ribosomal protein S9
MTNTYFYAVGRRKTSTATVKLIPSGSGKIEVIRKDGIILPLKEYFGGNTYLYDNAIQPLQIVWLFKKFDATVKLSGGWIMGNSDAIKLAFARALVEYDTSKKPELKAQDLLMRDSRRKERKKYWLKKARKAPTWSKR